MLTNLPVPHDFCTGDPISHLFTMGSMYVQQSVLIVSRAFNYDSKTSRNLPEGSFEALVNVETVAVFTNRTAPGYY